MEENNLMEEISFKKLFYTIKKRAWLIVATTVVALLISIIINFFVIIPEYEAITTLMFAGQEDFETTTESAGAGDTGELIEETEDELVDKDYSNVLSNEKLMPTYSELAKSRLVGERVMKNLNLDISYTDYKEKIQVDIVPETYFIKIIAKDSNRNLASDIANDLAKESIKASRAKFGEVNIEIIDKAKTPKEPFRPKKLLNVLISTSLGIIVGLFLTFLLENLGKTT